MSKSLTDKTITGINWNLTKTYGKTVLNIVVGIVLARLLPPEDFGLLGMTVIFIGFADLFSTIGMGASIIKLKDLTEDHIRVATTFTLILGSTVFLIFWFTAPLIADFYNEDRLVDILHVLSIMFVLKGFTTVNYAQIVKDINFKAIFKIELFSFIFGRIIISISLAILGFGVWSLVLGRLFTSLSSAFHTIRIKPPKLKPLFKKKELLELLSFGGGVSLSGIIHFVATNIDYLIIGKYLTPFMLGLYQKSYNLMTEPIKQVSSGIYNVLFPAFAEVQDDVLKLRKGYLRTLQSVAFLLFPVLAAMIVCGDYIILGLYGPNWEGAINVFKILVFAGFFRATLSYSGALAQSTGKVYNEMRQQLLYVTVLTASVFYGVQFGIDGVGVAVVFSLFVLFVAQSYLAIKIIEVNWVTFLLALMPGLINAALVSIIDFVFIYFYKLSGFLIPDPVMLVVLIVVSILAYFICILFLPRSLKLDTMDWILSKYGKFIPKKILSFYLRFNKSL